MKLGLNNKKTTILTCTNFCATTLRHQPIGPASGRARFFCAFDLVPTTTSSSKWKEWIWCTNNNMPMIMIAMTLGEYMHNCIPGRDWAGIFHRNFSFAPFNYWDIMNLWLPWPSGSTCISKCITGTDWAANFHTIFSFAPFNSWDNKIILSPSQILC